MKRRTSTVMGVFVVGLAALLLVYVRRSPSTTSATKQARSFEAAPQEPAAERSPTGTTGGPANAKASSEPAALPATNRARDPKLNDRLREADEKRRQIAELARTSALPSARPTQSFPAAPLQIPSAQDAPAMPAVEGQGNQAGKPLGNYVNTLLKQQFKPVAIACYEELLSRHPTAAGRMIMNVQVVGDRRVGGVVEAVEIDPKSTIEDGEFRLCMRESMFATVFDAPPGGEGEVTFTYPLELAP